MGDETSYQIDDNTIPEMKALDMKDLDDESSYESNNTTGNVGKQC